MAAQGRRTKSGGCPAAAGALYLSGVAEMGSDAAEAQQWLSRAAAQGSAQARKLLAQAEKIKSDEQAQYQAREQARKDWERWMQSTPSPTTGTGATTAGSATDVRWCHAHQCASPPPIPFVLIFSNLERKHSSCVNLPCVFWLCSPTLALTACVTPGGGSITTGNAATASTGAAGGASSVNANPSLERCDAPLGTLAVDDGRDKEWYGSFGAASQNHHH